MKNKFESKSIPKIRINYKLKSGMILDKLVTKSGKIFSDVKIVKIITDGIAIEDENFIYYMSGLAVDYIQVAKDRFIIKR